MIYCAVTFEIPSLVPILEAHVAHADVGLDVKTLVSHGAGLRAASGEVLDVDLTNHVGRAARTGGGVRLAQVERSAVVVKVISEAQINDVVGDGHRCLAVYLAHQARRAKANAGRIRKHIDVIRDSIDTCSA